MVRIVRPDHRHFLGCELLWSSSGYLSPWPIWQCRYRYRPEPPRNRSKNDFERLSSLLSELSRLEMEEETLTRAILEGRSVSLESGPPR